MHFHYILVILNAFSWYFVDFVYMSIIFWWFWCICIIFWWFQLHFYDIFVVILVLLWFLVRFCTWRSASVMNSVMSYSFVGASSDCARWDQAIMVKYVYEKTWNLKTNKLYESSRRKPGWRFTAGVQFSLGRTFCMYFLKNMKFLSCFGSGW